MALIKCPECGKEVSDKATACIHCGYPLTSMDKSVIDQSTNITQGEKSERVPHSSDEDVRFDESVVSQENEETVPISKTKPANTKRKKGWLVILAVLLVAFVIWKIVGPKTVESGNGYSHQVWDFKEECDYSEWCGSDHATHRIHHFFGDCGYYCDDCWGKFDGQETFNRYANKSSKSSSSERATDAKICAKKAVEDQLKSPSTAKYCNYTEMTATNLGGNKWKITGYVDAQNSFGATLRENWTVTLTLTTSGFTDATVTFE